MGVAIRVIVVRIRPVTGSRFGRPTGGGILPTAQLIHEFVEQVSHLGARSLTPDLAMRR
jgi:hypothetical protein